MSRRHTPELTVLGLPVEEGVFFVLARTLVADLLLLLSSPVLQARPSRCADGVRQRSRPTPADHRDGAVLPA